MRSLLIRGGKPLYGEIKISGSKNAVLPMLAATVIFQKPCLIRNSPALTDVAAAVEILRYLGAEVRREGSDIHVNPRPISRWEIPEPLMGKMRGSVFFAGPLMAKFGRCRLASPGGCPLGERPVDFHALGFAALGAETDKQDPAVFRGRLSGTELCLPYPSVGATENLLMAALGASGTTIIRNAAREPEIVCLCDFLRSGGAKITGDGTPVIQITGGLPESGEGTVIPDRMETATFACAAASAGGCVRLNRAEHTHLAPVLDALERAGCRVGREQGGICIEAGPLESPGVITTEPYPGFPTDAQAPFMAAMLRVNGETIIKETVFSDRMRHVEGLRAMGANIALKENTACITGVKQLIGAKTTATDLRGGAALAIAALAAPGESEITGLHHILRGYENFAEKLHTLGADARVV